MGDESSHKSKIVTNLRRNGIYARRVEDKWLVGFPDMFVILPGVGTVFIEAKMVRTQQFSPSPRQYVELKELHNPENYTFGVVMGIRENPTRYGFSLPAPVIPVNDIGWYNDFLDGLRRLIDDIGPTENRSGSR